MKKSYVLMCVLLSATLLTACGDKISTEEIKSAIQDSVPSISQLAEGPTAITFKTDNGEITNYTVTEDGDKITVTDEDGKTVCTFSVSDFDK
ncbi:hypothetical protein [Butyricicoccus intestinisimiae]|uniref:PepSY domain-containing protein n=1 Tax=Butyricicoccus intestinisimiae TaxID=2841509 RepID=A0ABS6EQP4_9FIRM|nr:hypothetical protein [Butyricicoccus intestinisimiae]MBU5490022.1 hypothetical protein [Butyricicoccus intestinisimiae]